MIPLGAIVRWCAGPVFGITCGLVLGALADGPTQAPLHVTMLAAPPTVSQVADVLGRANASAGRHPGWTMLAAVSD